MKGSLESPRKVKEISAGQFFRISSPVRSSRLTCISILIGLMCSGSCLADTPRSNDVIVAAGHDGTCYAKSVPSGWDGQEGKTSVYDVGRRRDKLVHQYDWYSLGIYLACNVWRDDHSETIVVRMGPWAEGIRANSTDLGVALYSNGKLLKLHTTLDIAGNANNVSSTISHYSVFHSIQGFQWQSDGSLDFIATRADGMQLRFSSLTGMFVESKP